MRLVERSFLRDLWRQRNDNIEHPKIDFDVDYHKAPLYLSSTTELFSRRRRWTTGSSPLAQFFASFYAVSTFLYFVNTWADTDVHLCLLKGIIDYLPFPELGGRAHKGKADIWRRGWEKRFGPILPSSKWHIHFTCRRRFCATYVTLKKSLDVLVENMFLAWDHLHQGCLQCYQIWLFLKDLLRIWQNFELI